MSLSWFYPKHFSSSPSLSRFYPYSPRPYPGFTPHVPIPVLVPVLPHPVLSTRTIVYFGTEFMSSKIISRLDWNTGMDYWTGVYALLGGLIDSLVKGSSRILYPTEIP